MPVTLGTLLLAFGALVAAGLPLMLARTSSTSRCAMLSKRRHTMDVTEALTGHEHGRLVLADPPLGDRRDGRARAGLDADDAPAA